MNIALRRMPGQSHLSRTESELTISSVFPVSFACVDSALAVEDFERI